MWRAVANGGCARVVSCKPRRPHVTFRSQLLHTTIRRQTVILRWPCRAPGPAVRHDEQQRLKITKNDQSTTLPD